MKKIVMGSMLATGFLFAGHAQAHTEDALIGGLVGLSVGTSIASHHRHRPVVHHHYDRRPVRQVCHVYPHLHPHPQGKAHGYWRKHGKHHYAHHRDRDDRYYRWHRDRDDRDERDHGWRRRD